MLGGPFRSHQSKGCLAFQCAGESLPSLPGGSGEPGKPVRSPAGSAASPRPDRPSKITQSKVSAGADGLIIRAPGIVLVKMNRLGLADFFLKVPEREPPKENEGVTKAPPPGCSAAASPAALVYRHRADRLSSVLLEYLGSSYELGT